jgi:hypothetical protein
LFYISTEAFGESTGRWATAVNYLKDMENILRQAALEPFRIEFPGHRHPVMARNGGP